MTWIDTPWPQDPARLKAGGYDIMRYICSDWNTGPGTSMPNKRISRAELNRYIAAGVDVAVNFEDAADDYLGGYARGLEKGRKAGSWMLGTLSWPAGGVCCSSIDADIGTTWGGLAQAYQQGFSDGLTSTGPYLPGIYGPAPALNGANRDGTAHVFWLTAATSWSHGIQPDVLHMWQNGYWPYGSDADLNVTVLEPIGSYLKPLGGDMPLTDDDVAKIWAAQLTPNGTAVQHLVSANDNARAASNYGKANSGKLDNLKVDVAAIPTEPVDQPALERAILAAIAAALAGGVPIETIEQGVTNALAGASIPVNLTGHAGTPPAAL